MEESTRVGFVEIPTDELFYGLWTARVIERINHATDSILDDYEEDWVSLDRLEDLTAALDRVAIDLPAESETHDIVLRIAELSRQAAREGRPLLFVL